MISWPNGMPPTPSTTTIAPNTMPPPRMRQSIGRRSVVSVPRRNTPATEIAGMISPIRKTSWRGMKLASHPDRPATASTPADTASRPSTCTMPSSTRTSSSGRSLPCGVGARHHLGGHRVRHHVLHHGADRHQHRAEDVEVVGAGEGEPAAGGAGQDDQARRHECRADQDVGFPLRAEDRHGVDQFAEHHLHGPGQRQPDARCRRVATA